MTQFSQGFKVLLEIVLDKQGYKMESVLAVWLYGKRVEA